MKTEAQAAIDHAPQKDGPTCSTSIEMATTISPQEETGVQTIIHHGQVGLYVYRDYPGPCNDLGGTHPPTNIAT